MDQYIMRRSPKILGSISQLSSGVDSLFNSFFEDDFFRDELSMSKSNSRLPKINVLEDNDKYTVEAAVPGVDKKEIEIKVTNNNSISISYDKREEKESKTDAYLIRELSGRSFQRIIPFYKKIDKDKIKAKVENGMLKVEICKINNKVEDKKDKVIAVE